MMLTGDNGILTRAGEAKEKTDEATAKEQIQMEVLGSYATDNLNIDKDKLKTNLGKIGATVTEAGQSLMVTLDGQVFAIDSKGNVEKASDEYLARNGIEVGDYVTYIPPKDNGTVKSYSLTAGASGYTADQTLTQQYNIWRVLNKNADGSLDIMPAFKDSGVSYTSIFFRDAKGWNNAPYLLDDMCSYLYADETKGITTRSMDYEDITSHMIEGVEGTTLAESTGLKKISKFQSEKVAALTTGIDIDAIDINTNTVTYKDYGTSHPTSYFEVKDDESNPFYTSSTIDTDSSSNGRIGTKPTTLPVKYTSYDGTIASTDFENSNAHNVIFGTGARYLLASRCVSCDHVSWGDYASFLLQCVDDGSKLSAVRVYYSYGYPINSNGCRVSPIVTLGSKSEVTKCTGANSENNRHTVAP